MPSLSFQSRFVPLIESGSKQHSIRAERQRPFKVGDTLHLYTAMRTKQCRLLGRATCVKVEEIKFERARVWIAGIELEPGEKDLFAWRDGFRWHFGDDCEQCRDTKGCFGLMLQFWVDTRKTTDFHGQLIHWDWNRREVTR